MFVGLVEKLEIAKDFIFFFIIVLYFRYHYKVEKGNNILKFFPKLCGGKSVVREAVASFHFMLTQHTT